MDKRYEVIFKAAALMAQKHTKMHSTKEKEEKEEMKGEWEKGRKFLSSMYSMMPIMEG